MSVLIAIRIMYSFCRCCRSASTDCGADVMTSTTG